MGLPPAPKGRGQGPAPRGATKHEGGGAASPGLGLAVRSAVVVGTADSCGDTPLAGQGPGRRSGSPPSPPPGLRGALRGAGGVTLRAKKALQALAK